MSQEDNVDLITSSETTENTSYLDHIYVDATQRILHFSDNMNPSDIFLFYSGMSQCPPGHIWGPAIRDHFVIHYILSGQGTFQLDNRQYNLKKDDGFLISPGVFSTYWASEDDPWTYIWIGFHGVNAKNFLSLANLTDKNPIFHFKRGRQIENILLETIRFNKDYSHSTSFRIQALLYQLFAELVENARPSQQQMPHAPKETHIRKSLTFIQSNYMEDITIEKIAAHVNLHRSYFSKLFKEHMGISPSVYLSNYRLTRAARILINTDFTITEIANMSGFNDVISFTRAFKSVYHHTPSIYRKQHRHGYNS